MAHIPVLLQEVIAFFEPAPGKKYIDATIGSGGHSAVLLAKGARVLGIDLDQTATARLADKLKVFGDQAKIVSGSFSELQAIAEKNNFIDVDGVLFDFGLSSEQLDDPKRGFAFQQDGPLDMRFDNSQTGKTAADLLNTLPERELLKLFLTYGEERRFGKKIARAIVQRRKVKSLETTGELFDIVKRALPGAMRFRAGDAGRRIFQALRIAVNDELGRISQALPQAITVLRSGGRLAAISFHSLEDRIVKNFFIQRARACICPPDFPICRCGSNHALLKILTKKPITASLEETKTNSRSRSAKLRVAEKL